MKTIKLCCCPDSVSAINLQGPHCQSEQQCEPDFWLQLMKQRHRVATRNCSPAQSLGADGGAVRSRQLENKMRKGTKHPPSVSGITSHFTNVSLLSTA